MNSRIKTSLPFYWSALLLYISACHAQTDEKVVDRTLKRCQGKHVFVVRLVAGPIRKERHKIEIKATNIRLDGKPESNKDGSRNWYGTDGGTPLSEFYAFDVTVDGKRWYVPKKLWADCYDPNLRTGKDGSLWVKFSSDGKQLNLKMYGSDGAGSYYVTWFLRADGQNSRKVEGAD